MSYAIHAIHEEGAKPIVETGKRYISAFEGKCGDGWVLSVDRKTHKGTLMSNDINKPMEVSVDQPTGNLILDQSEILWLQACWMSILGVGFKEVETMFRKSAEKLAYEVLAKMGRSTSDIC